MGQLQSGRRVPTVRSWYVPADCTVSVVADAVQMCSVSKAPGEPCWKFRCQIFPPVQVEEAKDDVIEAECSWSNTTATLVTVRHLCSPMLTQKKCITSRANQSFAAETAWETCLLQVYF